MDLWGDETSAESAVVMALFKTNRKKTMSYNNKKVTVYIIIAIIFPLFVFPLSGFRARKSIICLSVYFAIRIDLF